MEKNEILVIYGNDYRDMARQVLAAAQIERRIPNRQARIGLKPNLVVASPAEEGATTHVELLAGTIEYLQEKGFDNIGVYEGSWVGDRTAQAFRACGYDAVAQRYGVDLIDTQKQGSYQKDCAGMPLKLCDCVREIDFLINFPVMKGHCQTHVTCALKNMKGLIPNSEKRRFHTLGLMKPIAHLNVGIRQDFILVDAICGDLNFEEGGNPVPRGQVLGFLDPVLCDAYACESMGYALDEVPYIGMAEALGVGSADVTNAKVIELNQPGDAPVKLRASRRIQSLARHVEARDACSACYANLIYALARLDDEGMLGWLEDKICIGQGFKGKSGKLGVGQCTCGFEKYVRGCPPSAMDCYRELLGEG